MSLRLLGLSHVAAARSKDLFPKEAGFRQDLKCGFGDGIEVDNLGKLLEIVEAEIAPKDTTIAFVGRPFALPEYLTSKAFSSPRAVFEHIKTPRITVLGSTKTEGIPNKSDVRAALGNVSTIDSISLLSHQYPKTYSPKVNLAEVNKVKDSSNNDMVIVVSLQGINEPSWQDWTFTPPDNIMGLAEHIDENSWRHVKPSLLTFITGGVLPKRELVMNKSKLPVIYITDEPSPKLLEEIDILAKKTQGPIVLVTSKKNPSWLVTLDKKESFKHIELPPAFEDKQNSINVGTMILVLDNEVIPTPYKFDKEVLNELLSVFDKQGKTYWDNSKKPERLIPILDKYRNNLVMVNS